MKRSEVRAFIEAGVNEMVPAIEFGAGLVSDFNSLRSHSYPAVWQVTSASTSEHSPAGAPLDTWEIQLIVGQRDRMDSSPEEYEHIIDDCDEIAQKLIYKYRNIVDGHKTSTMTNVSREPFVKKHADCITGVTLSFSLISHDRTNVC